MKSRYVRHILRQWRAHFTLQLATVGVLTGTFTVIVLCLLIHQNIREVLVRWGDSIQISVYLNDKAAADEITAISEQLKGLESFGEIEFVSKDEALERFKKQMASYSPRLLEDKQLGNPLPASFEVKLKPGTKTSGTLNNLQNIAQAILQWEGVEDVSYGQGWVDNYADFVASFSRSSWILVLILGIGSIFVIGNSIRSSIYQRREEVEVLELVGATGPFIRTPFIFEGTLLGLFAAVLALLFSYTIFSWQSGVFNTNLGLWGMGAQFSYLPMYLVLFILAGGAAMGAAGSYLCISGISHGWSAAENNSGRR